MKYNLDQARSIRQQAPELLFLSWQDEVETRQWFPVGRLNVEVEAADYRFRYTGGARRAREEVGYPLAVEFPDLERDYRASALFPTFRNRVMSPRRPDFAGHVRRPLGQITDALFEVGGRCRRNG